MEKVKRTAKVWLCISLALMLLSGIVVYVVQTDSGKVNMKELNIETDAGYSMSAYLFIPPNATADTPAPGIVTSHGYLNNKEMQDANYVELARRGYVVLAIDQPSHGDSEILQGFGLFGASGVYYGAQALSRMPFVDKDKIGITGHSMGGMSCNNAIAQDNLNEKPIISAVLLNCADATYQADGAYANIYGNRDVGILSAQYDEFFHVRTDENGKRLEAPFFMEGPSAQSFLNFGVDPAGLEARAADTIYRQDVDGEEAIRVIYRPDIIHPWSHFSAKATTRVIEFFDAAFGAPTAIAAGNQIWQWKEAFNFVGLIGFAIFLCAFTTLMVFTPAFSSLRAEKPAVPQQLAKGGALWFWCSLAAGALFSMLIYRWILNVGTGMKVAQTEAMGLGMWSTLCGVFTILCMLVSYFCFGRKNGMNLAEAGVKISFKKCGLTVLLALIVVTVAYGIIFVLDYFFFADFRIWTLALKAFELPILKYCPYMLLFITFYVASSVATNSFNYNTVGGKVGNILINGVFTALPALVLPWMQYIHYYTQKAMLWPADNMHILWLFPIVLILFGSTVINRIIYKATKNPYLGGLINALIVGLLTITNTCTAPM